MISIKNKIIASAALCCMAVVTVYASVTNGTIDSANKTTKICQDTSCSVFGRVNFAPTINASTPGAVAISITDSGITGNAWGDEIGWINMNPTGAGVTVNPNTGTLSGYAYAQNGSWINFGATGAGVTLLDNGSGSNFSGYAWVSGNRGGWLKFDCGSASTCIKTDWRSIPNRTTPPVTGGGAGGGGPTPTPPVVPTVPTVPVIPTTPVLPNPPTGTTPNNSGNSGGGQKPNISGLPNTGQTNTGTLVSNPFDTNGDGIPDLGPDGKSAVGDGSLQTTDDGVYKSLFPIRASRYVNQKECTFCIILRKNLPDETIKHKQPVLKWAFVPRKFEWRLPLSTTFLQPKSKAPLPDLDLTSTIGTVSATWGIWKILATLLIK